jgi:hypothetical protein
MLATHFSGLSHFSADRGRIPILRSDVPVPSSETMPEPLVRIILSFRNLAGAKRHGGLTLSTVIDCT